VDLNCSVSRRTRQAKPDAAAGAIKTPIWKRGARAAMPTDEPAKEAQFFSSVVPLGRWG
jgi:hypothetical protein